MILLWLCGSRWTGLTIAGRPSPGFLASVGTQREMLQTAEIVQRLQRGEDLHEQGGLSRYY